MFALLVFSAFLTCVQYASSTPLPDACSLVDIVPRSRWSETSVDTSKLRAIGGAAKYVVIEPTQVAASGSALRTLLRNAVNNGEPDMDWSYLVAEKSEVIEGELIKTTCELVQHL